MNQMSAITPAPVGHVKARFTTAEFQRILESGAFDDWKIELVDGELERMQYPKNIHAMRQARVMFELMRVIGVERTRGEIGIDLGHDTMVACDAAVLRVPLADNRWLRAGDLLLAVEIAETTIDRDLGIKRLKYAAAGIPEYWVVDGARSVTHVFRQPRDGDYAELSLARFGEPLAVPGTRGTIVID